MLNEIKRTLKVFKSKYKIIGIFFLVVFIMAYFMKMDFYMILGDGYCEQFNLVELSYSFFVKSMYIYISLIVFRYDVAVNKEQIFQRISKKRWLYIKIFSIIFINFIIYSVILFVACILTNNIIDMNKIINIFIVNLILVNTTLLFFIINKEKYIMLFITFVITIISMIPLVRIKYLSLLNCNVVLLLLIYCISFWGLKLLFCGKGRFNE